MYAAEMRNETAKTKQTSEEPEMEYREKGAE